MGRSSRRIVLAGGVALIAAAWPASASAERPALANIGHPPAVPRGATRVGTLDAAAGLRLTVLLAPRDPVALADFASAVSTPGSSQYRHYLPPGRFAATFGAAPDTIAAVESALRAQGLQPRAVAADGLALSVVTTAAAAGRALHVGFSRYRLGSGRVAFANTTAPELPSELHATVQGVLGLDNLTAREAAPGPRAVPASGPQACAEASSSAAARNAYTPAQLAHAYELDGLYGTGDLGQGVSVALYELEPNSSDDIDHYQSCFGTHATVTYTPVDDGAGIGPGQMEAALDIEDVIGLAPAAAVHVYQGPNTEAGAYDTLARIVTDDDSQVVSLSWGECEPSLPEQDFQAENVLFQEAAAQGQTVVAASGDDGSKDCGDGLAVDDPASQPFVTGVGGTRLTLSPQPAESVWNDALGAPGGGLSQHWTMPLYQHGVISAPDSSGTPCAAVAGDYCREVPDVAADAAPSTGYLIYHADAWKVVGGTSAAAPLWAALVALADASQLGDCSPASPLGFLNPALYGLPASGAFRDVTLGNNDFKGTAGGSYPARSGYDLATGLGTPLAYGPAADGLVAQLCHAVHDAPAATAIAPADGPQSGGTTVTITGAHLSSPGTTVTFGPTAATSVDVANDGSLTAVAPPGAGTVAVTVSNAYGTSPPVSYTYDAPDPTPTPDVVAADSPTPTPTPPAAPTAVATPIPTPTATHAIPAPARTRLALTVTGALRYRLNVSVAAAAVHVTRDARGQIVRISARVRVKGKTGKPATLAYSLVRRKGGWTGTISISDPGARLHQRFVLDGTPKQSRGGDVSGHARATVHHRRASLRFALSPA